MPIPCASRSPRSVVFTLACLLVTVGCAHGTGSSARAAEPTTAPLPMIHVSDLFRPHNDPDDHWDLACVYALAARGLVDLRAVLIDYPQPERGNDPDVLAVAQMNYLTGLAVPVTVGSPRWVEKSEFDSPEAVDDLCGIRAMLDILRNSPEPVVISILGSCRDVALAGVLEPELFREKCRAIYLNAGSGTPDPEKAARLEWNVRLDPRSYATIFTLPCPVYWMPCFEEVGQRQVATYGTFYRFRQGDILPQLDPGVQRYFAYAFQHGRFFAEEFDEDQRPNWLRYLGTEPDPSLMQRIRAMDRNMWCTGGFLHAAGLTVMPDGAIVPLAQASDPVFTFDPVEVTCSDEGVTTWQEGRPSDRRFLFHVQDTQRYQAAMTRALGRLLASSFGRPTSAFTREAAAEGR